MPARLGFWQRWTATVVHVIERSTRHVYLRQKAPGSVRTRPRLAAKRVASLVFRRPRDGLAAEDDAVVFPQPANDDLAVNIAQLHDAMGVIHFLDFLFPRLLDRGIGGLAVFLLRLVRVKRAFELVELVKEYAGGGTFQIAEGGHGIEQLLLPRAIPAGTVRGHDHLANPLGVAVA